MSSVGPGARPDGLVPVPRSFPQELQGGGRSVVICHLICNSDFKELRDDVPKFLLISPTSVCEEGLSVLHSLRK